MRCCRDRRVRVRAADERGIAAADEQVLERSPRVRGYDQPVPSLGWIRVFGARGDASNGPLHAVFNFRSHMHTASFHLTYFVMYVDICQ